MEKDQLIRFKSARGEWVEKEYQEASWEDIKEFLKAENGTKVFLPTKRTKQMLLEDWEELLDPKKYGIWLNGDKVTNDSLKNLTPEDIFRYSIRDGKRLKRYGNFELQYFALTKDYVKKKYSYKDRFGFWADLEEHLKLLAEVETRAAKQK